ncbi:MAG: hypothetical protein EXX96DRAFT_590051 [Benjaminiella poitrasii]|nr:MAG: hypothetical protein EXX96DRAFT_590051 [Benjaminiella poitrasii]
MSLTPVFIAYHCYICDGGFSSPKALINHLERIHSTCLPGRKPGKNRPKHPEYEYKKTSNEPGTIIRYGCPSCWFHCEDSLKKTLAEHVKQEHANEISYVTDKKSKNNNTAVASDGHLYQVQEYNAYNECEPGYLYNNNGNYYYDNYNDHMMSGDSNHKQDGNTTENEAKQKELLGLVDDLVANFKKLFTSSISTKGNTA